MNLFKLSWKNIIHKPLSALLSILLFALGIGLIVMLLLFNKQLKDNFDKNLAGIDLVIGAKGSPLQLILNSMYHIDAPTGNIAIEDAAPFLNPKHPLIQSSIPLSLGDSYRGYRIVGTSPDLMDLYQLKIAQGQNWKADFEVVVGHLVAKLAKLKIGDTFQSTHGLDDNPDLEHEHDTRFKVVGIFEKSGTVADQLILTTPQTIWDVHGGHNEEAQAETEAHDHDHEHEGNESHAQDAESHEGHDHAHDNETRSVNEVLLDHKDQDITSMLVRFKSRTNIQALNMLRGINANTNLMAASPAIEINRLYSMVGVGTEAIQGIAIAIAIVSALSIFISLFNSLRDRKYELALMRVSGGSRSDLFSLITLEGIVLSLIGAVFGIILGHIGMGLFSKLLAKSYKYDFDPFEFLPQEAIVFGVAILIGVIAAVIPAWQASKTDIHDTLSGN
jgi:putative ABC transport system permease protein